MKKLLIAFSMIGAGALIASAATDKTRTNDWFSVTTTSTIGGTFAPTGDATLDVVTGKFVIDSDLASPVTFTTATGNGLTQNLSRVSFDLEAAVVPSSALPTGKELTDKGAKVAFAIVKGSEGNVYQAWLGDAWQALSGTLPAENTYTLVMDFDKHDGNKVRFSVDGEVLTAAADSASWLTYATAVENTVSVDFIGSASVGSFLGNQIEITGEVIVIPGKGEIDVRKDDVAAVAATATAKGYSVDAFLAADAKAAFSGFVTEVKVAEAYALGLVKKVGNEMVPVDNGELKIAADAQANVANGIPVNLNIVPPPPADTGATISYQLMGSTTGAEGDYASIGDPTTRIEDIKIPTASVATDKLRYFKVETTVTLKTLQQ